MLPADLLSAMLSAHDPVQVALDRDAADAPQAKAPPALTLDDLLNADPADMVRVARETIADPTMLGVTGDNPTPAPQGEQAPVDLLLGATVSAPTPAPTPDTLQAKLAELSARLASRSPAAPAPVQSRAARAASVGGTAEFTKLPAYKSRPARWALLCFGDRPQAGQWVQVAKRNGAVESHEVTRVLFQKGQGWVCEFRTLAAAPQKVCPGNGDCRRYGHKKGSRCDPAY